MPRICQHFFICILYTLILSMEHCERGNAEKENDQDKSACKKMTEKEKQNWSVVLYEESTVVPIHKSERKFIYSDHEFIIKQEWSKLGVAAVVWDAAEILCEYLVRNPSVIQGKKIIELGAGTGLVGMVAALLGGTVTITDRDTVMEFLKLTLKDNLPKRVLEKTTVKALDWRDRRINEFVPVDVILGADIVYIEEVFEDLLHTLSDLSNKETLIFLSCRIRYDRDTSFLSRLESLFTVDHIFYDQSKDVHIYKAIKI